MASLYQLTEDLIRLEALLTESTDDTGEIDAALNAFWESKEGEFAAKVDNYCALIRILCTRSEARREESKRMAELAGQDWDHADRLKEALKTALERRNCPKVETDRFSVSVKKNGGKAPLNITGEVPPEYKRTKTVEMTDTAKIAADLDAGIVLPFASYHPRGTRLEIK